MNTSLRLEPYPLLAADLGPKNPLPYFREPIHDTDVAVDATVSPDDRHYLGWEISRRILPYRLQDGYNRRKRPRDFASVVLENDQLKATFLPELGARLVSLVHRATDRELLDRNPVFQPANLALRNAWFSGGIEWNASQFGHHYLTCSPVFAARVDAPEGYPFLRVYEWDRVKCFPWQIDFHLPPGSPYLFAHVRLTNPQRHELPMYWWTNMAVPEKDGVRVLAPASTALRGSAGQPLSQVDMPAAGFDPTSERYAREFYCRIPSDRRRWIAALDRTGSGLVETSTRRLRGRKLFAWGMNEGGRHWQEYLARPGSTYLEIQAGLGRTQLESVPMPAGAEWTWTEAFGFLDQAADVEAALDANLTEARLDEWHHQFSQASLRPANVRLATGSGWGALERRRDPQMIPAHLEFDEATLGTDQAPWLALLKSGEFPEHEIGAWMVQPEWRELLERSNSDHWLRWLHLGNMQMEHGDVTGAANSWQTSLARRRNAWALRNLSVIEQRAGNWDAAAALLAEAWQVGPKVPALAIETVALLAQLQRDAELTAFVEQLPRDIRHHERIQIPAGAAALRQGRWKELEPLFEREFVTIREGETALTDLWFEWQNRRGGTGDLQPPAHLDFRIAGA